MLPAKPAFHREMAFPWRQGGLTILDNVYTFHGRNPYTGRRDVQVAG